MYTPYAGRLRYEFVQSVQEDIDRTDAARRIEALLEEVLRQLTVHDG